jgi:hypothetical protein
MVRNLRITIRPREVAYCPKLEHFKLMDINELQRYRSLFTSLPQVERELEAVRSYLVQCELPSFYQNIPAEEHKKAVAKFTQLFKALLEVKHQFESKM